MSLEKRCELPCCRVVEDQRARQNRCALAERLVRVRVGVRVRVKVWVRVTVRELGLG